jgi:hypothetical protein
MPGIVDVADVVCLGRQEHLETSVSNPEGWDRDQSGMWGCRKDKRIVSKKK